jgi:hypothetical protein
METEKKEERKEEKYLAFAYIGEKQTQLQNYF